MKKLISLLGLTFLIVSFQNCSQTKVVPSSAAPAATGIDSEQIPAKDFSKVILWDPEQLSYLDVNVSNGQMLAFEQNGDPRGDKYCLTPSELSEVKTLLANSDICEPHVDYEAVKDRVCTMIYKYPYASIVKDNTEYRLGEINSGCDKPVDLCGDHAAMLKSFATAILKSLESRRCQ